MSNTAKRFFNNNWDQPSFSKLTTEQKLLYKYLWERCNIAGVYMLNYPIMTAYLGFSINNEIIDSLIECIDSEIEKIDNKFVWFKEFVRFQQKDSGGSLSETSPPHKSVVKQLKKTGLYQKAYHNDPELYLNYPKPTLSQPLPKDNSNSNGSGNSPSSGTGQGSSNGSSSYSLSKSISERLTSDSSCSSHELTKQINEIAKELKDKQGVLSPFNHIEYVLKEMEQYYPKDELTINALIEKLGLTNNQ